MKRNSCLSLLLVMLPAQLAAQAEPPVVPTALARVAAGDFFDVKAKFVVDQPPSTWPKRILPGAPARVIGGVVSGPATMLLLSYPRSADGLAQLEKLLQGAGYTRPPKLDNSRFGSMSVVAFGPGGPGNPPNLFCSDSGDVILTPSDSTADTRLFVMALMKRGESYGTMCNPPKGMSWEDHMPLKIPPLTPPPGARVFGSGSGGGGGNMTTSMQIDSTYDAPFLVKHYGTQLAAGGWTVGAPAHSGATSMVPLIAKDDKGREWRGLLVVVPLATQREITIHMAAGRDVP